MHDYATPYSDRRPLRSMIKVPDRIDDLDLQAFVDNQASLTPDDAIRIRQAIDENETLRRRYEGLQRQKHMLQMWWDETKRETLQ